MRDYPLILVFLFWATSSFGMDIMVEDEEDLLDLLTLGEISYGEYIELRWLLRKGVDINTDEVWELLNVPGVEEEDIGRIVEWRKRVGSFKKIEELWDIPGMDDEVLRRISPFVCIFPKRPLTIKGKAKVEIEKVLGDERSPEVSNYIRIFYGGALQGYVLQKKKKGEERIKMVSRYIRLQDTSVVKRIEIGDCRVKFGEGLVIGGRFDGVVGELRFGPIRPSFLYSHPPEKEKLIGGNLDVDLFPKTTVGIGYLKWKREAFGFHLWIPIGEGRISSAYAKVKDGGEGFIMVGRLDKKSIRVLGVYRAYGNHFLNPYSDGFSQPDCEDDDADEVGFYLGVEYKISPNFRARVVSDHWYHPSTFAKGKEFEGRVYLKASSKLSVRFLRGWRKKEEKGKVKNSFEISLRPAEDIRLSLYLRISKEEERESGFARVKVGYEVIDGLLVEGYLRVKRMDIHKQKGSSTKYYLQLKDRLSERLSLLVRFTNTIRWNHPEEHFYKFSLEALW